MMTLEEYIAAQKEKMFQVAETPARRNWLDRVRETCRSQGFFVIRMQKKKNPILVNMHNLPCDFDRDKCMHRHDYFEMIYVYRGNYINRMPKQTLYLSEGDMMLLNPNVLHSPYCEQSTDVIFNIIIKNDFVHNTLVPAIRESPLLLNFFIDPLYRGDKAQKYLYFHRNNSEILSSANRFLLEHVNQQRFSDTVMEASLLLLFAQIAREYDTMPPLRSKESNIYDILSFINRECTTVTLEMLSEKFSYSKSYLSRMIKKQSGKSFSELVHAEKIKLALLYLETTSLSITDVIKLSGFSDIKHFIQIFKDTFGKTPSQYRRDFQGRSDGT